MTKKAGLVEARASGFGAENDGVVASVNAMMPPIDGLRVPEREDPEYLNDDMWQLAALPVYHPERLQAVAELRSEYDRLASQERHEEALPVAADLAYVFDYRQGEGAPLAYFNGLDTIERALCQGLERNSQGYPHANTLSAVLRIHIARARAGELQGDEMSHLARVLNPEGIYASVPELEHVALTSALEVGVLMARYDFLALRDETIGLEDEAARQLLQDTILRQTTHLTGTTLDGLRVGLEVLLEKIRPDALPDRFGTQQPSLPGLELY